jgi:hypothetical protein
VAASYRQFRPPRANCQIRLPCKCQPRQYEQLAAADPLSLPILVCETTVAPVGRTTPYGRARSNGGVGANLRSWWHTTGFRYRFWPGSGDAKLYRYHRCASRDPVRGDQMKQP